MDNQTPLAQEQITPERLHDDLQPPTPQAPLKRKRLLSEKQLKALQRGRERRWKKMGLQEPENTEDNQNLPLPTVRYYDRDLTPQFAYDSSECSSADSSEDEQDIKQRKYVELRKSIPKSIRRRVDKYIRKN